MAGECPLVVHYWADLQSVHRFRCYDNIAQTRNASECLCSLHAWCYHCYVRVVDGRMKSQKPGLHSSLWELTVYSAIDRDTAVLDEVQRCPR